MYKIYKISQIIFTILTLIGAIFVFVKDGRVNAGYAVVPMLFSMLFLNLSNREKKKLDE